MNPSPDTFCIGTSENHRRSIELIHSISDDLEALNGVTQGRLRATEIRDHAHPNLRHRGRVATDGGVARLLRSRSRTESAGSVGVPPRLMFEFTAWLIAGPVKLGDVFRILPLAAQPRLLAAAPGSEI